MMPVSLNFAMSRIFATFLVCLVLALIVGSGVLLGMRFLACQPKMSKTQFLCIIGIALFVIPLVDLLIVVVISTIDIGRFKGATAKADQLRIEYAYFEPSADGLPTKEHVDVKVAVIKGGRLITGFADAVASTHFLRIKEALPASLDFAQVQCFMDGSEIYSCRIAGGSLLISQSKRYYSSQPGLSLAVKEIVRQSTDDQDLAQTLRE